MGGPGRCLAGARPPVEGWEIPSIIKQKAGQAHRGGANEVPKFRGKICGKCPNQRKIDMGKGVSGGIVYNYTP